MSKVDENMGKQKQVETTCTGIKNKVCKERSYMRLCIRMLINALLLEVDKSAPDELFRQKIDCVEIFSDPFKMRCQLNLVIIANKELNLVIIANKKPRPLNRGFYYVSNDTG